MIRLNFKELWKQSEGASKKLLESLPEWFRIGHSLDLFDGRETGLSFNRIEKKREKKWVIVDEPELW